MSEPLLGEVLKPRELEVLQLMAAGLSNEEIAARLFVEVTTVRWHNRQLYGKLGVHSRTLAVARARELGLLADGDTAPIKAATPGASRAQPAANLPFQATSFVGRERELAKARQLLATTRLLTLTGPGGTGKTRLALALAAAVQEHYADGVWFVPLAAVQDPDLVAVTVARVSEIAELPGDTVEQSLVKHLQGKHALLVLDNFEHVAEAASLLSLLMAGVPGLKLLVTSREVLHLYGEQEYPVPPLTVPEGEPVDGLEYGVDEVAQYEAVRLFVERARASQPAFALTAENAAAVAQICARLDGLPLALELAAARVKLLPPNQLLLRLEGGLGSLGQGPRDAPARQLTLVATMDWSYQLLNEREKQLFGRLGVFQGGWTLAAMEAVCGDKDQDLLETLNSLVDKSLVLATGEQNGEPRFRMLKVVREYAWAQLGHDAALEVRNRHRDWFLQMAERGGRGLQTTESQAWYARLRSEEDNLHAAMRRCLDDPQGTEIGLRFAAALPEYWHTRGAFRDARTWIATLLARGPKTNSSVRARALVTASMLEKLEHDFAAVEQYGSEALEIAQAVGDREAEAHALHFVAHVAQERGDHAEAQRLYQRSITLFQAHGSQWGAGETLNCFGDMQKQFGFLAAAEAALGQALALRRFFGNRRGVAATLSNLGHVFCRLGDTERAAALFREGLEIGQALGNKRLLCCSLCDYGGVAAIQGQAERAAILLSAGSHLLFAAGGAFATPDRVDFEWLVDQARQPLPAESFQAAWATGQQMSFEQALAYARLADGQGVR